MLKAEAVRRSQGAGVRRDSEWMRRQDTERPVAATRRNPLPYALAAAVTAAYCLISLTRFARLDTPSWDNAIFEQAVRGYAHFQAPIVDIKAPGFNQLGDHFSPILALLGPVYRLFPHAQTVMIAQAVLVGVSVVPIGWAALRALGTGRGMAVAAAYGLSFGVQSAIDVDFHEVAFAAPLLAFAGEAALRGRWRATAAWCLPLLLVKEDLGLTVAAIGAVAYLAGSRRIGWALAVAGAVGTAVTALLVIPAFSPSGAFGYWSLIGIDGGPSLWHNFFAAGWQLKGVTLAATFGVTGFLALRSPWALATVPTLAWRFAGDRESFWGIEWQYSLVLMPIVFVAAIDAVGRARRHPGGGGLGRFVAWAAPKVPVAMLVGALVGCAWLPIRGLVDGAAYRPDPRAPAAAAAISAMPRGATVEANLGLITHLTTDYRVYWFDSIGDAVAPDFVLFDTHTSDKGNIVAYAESQHPGVRYRIAFERDGYVLAERLPR